MQSGGALAKAQALHKPWPKHKHCILLAPSIHAFVTSSLLLTADTHQESSCSLAKAAAAGIIMSLSIIYEVFGPCLQVT